MKPNLYQLNKKHSLEWRDPMTTISFLPHSKPFNWSLLEHKTFGDFWDFLQETDLSLFISREYENFVACLSKPSSKSHPRISVQPLPHPSGMVFDQKHGRLYIAATRNPNQIFCFEIAKNFFQRKDALSKLNNSNNYFLPSFSRFLPGSYYIHDLAIIDSELHVNAVGHNAILKVPLDTSHPPQVVWIPKSLQKNKEARKLNYLQINSIASGKNIKSSFFSASSEHPQPHPPGHLKFKVDGQGVIFSGKTGEIIYKGLTRPHSLRFDSHRRLYVANSGYGELRSIETSASETLLKLNSWTRGVYIYKNYAIIGCSRVIYKFRHYAPGIQWQKSLCGLRICDLKTGKVIGGLDWPKGNQIFSIEAVPNSLTQGFVFEKDQSTQLIKNIFYSFNRERTP